MLMRKFALAFLAVLVLAGCSGAAQTVSRTQAQAELVAVEGLVTAARLYTVVKSSASPRCTKDELPLAVCRSLRQFGEGQDPKAPICRAPTLAAFGEVQTKCGFESSLPLAVEAYRTGASVASAVAEQIAATLKLLNEFAAKVGVK
jgi:hypothetical protein